MRQSAFWAIVRKEWLEWRRDRTLCTVVLLFLGFLIYGTGSGIWWASQRQMAQRQVASGQKSLIDKFREEANAYDRELQINPAAHAPDSSIYLTLGTTGVRPFLPLLPLAALSTGQAAIYPDTAQVTMQNHRPDLLVGGEADNPLNLLNGPMDLAFVLVYLYPLFIVAVSYGLLSTERESGSLSMMLAQPVTLRQVVLGKIAARGILLCGLASGASALAVLARSGNWQESAIWILAVVLYGVCWFAATAAVAGFGLGSTANAGLLTAVWLFMVCVLPAALNFVVSQIYPNPSSTQLLQASRRIGIEAEQRGEKVLDEYLTSHPGVASVQPGNFSSTARLYYAVHDAVARAIGPMIERFSQQQSRQQRFASHCRVASPAIAVQEVFDELAGTSASRYAAFVGEAEQFQTEWQAFFTSMIFRDAIMTTADYDALPTFHWREPKATGARRTIAALCALSAFGVLASLAAVYTLRSFSIR